MKKRKTNAKAKGPVRRPRRTPAAEIAQPENGAGITAVDARLTGGDVDADWQRADSVGDEAVGGSVATPDQDVVDEIGRALGVEQAPDAEVTTSREILERRDRLRWHLERDAELRGRRR
jgi:hypothetical protein